MEVAEEALAREVSRPEPVALEREASRPELEVLGPELEGLELELEGLEREREGSGTMEVTVVGHGLQEDLEAVHNSGEQVEQQQRRELQLGCHFDRRKR
jgi:hypothetical protein